MDDVASVWSELKRYINVVDRTEAAETVVGILIDNDHDAEEIRLAFRGDKDIKNALANYLDDNEDEDEDEELEEDYDDE